MGYYAFNVVGHCRADDYDDDELIGVCDLAKNMEEEE